MSGLKRVARIAVPACVGGMIAFAAGIGLVQAKPAACSSCQYSGGGLRSVTASCTRGGSAAECKLYRDQDRLSPQCADWGSCITIGPPR